ncbi:MAG: chromosome partitioning protein, partial [Silicimonas sp.]|nr:chromosome partitioning protein [Silicimonas sp.]
MAKRKRLEMPVIEPDSPGTETKSHLTPRARMPIADVAGDTAGRAALEEVAREMTAAETEGRVVK